MIPRPPIVILAALAVLVAVPAKRARAAEITEVADAADPGNPFDLRLEIGWSRDFEQAKITRENLQVDTRTGKSSIVDVTELRYQQVTSTLLPTLHVGLYHDLELHVTLPIVLMDYQTWWPAALSGLPANSTIHNAGGICANGTVDPSCAKDLFPFTKGSGKNNSYRGGLGDGTLGFTWGILNQDRDKWDPRWNIGVDWTFPSGGKRSPYDVSHSASDLKPVGHESNYFTFHTELSRRLGVVDPYFKMWYRLPVPTQRAFSNCDSPGRLADMDTTQPGVQNTCTTQNSYWAKSGSNHAGYKPSHTGGVDFGAEFVAYDDPDVDVKTAIDVGFGAQYVSEGRVYSELSDALGRLTYISDYAHFYGHLGVLVKASQYAKFHLTGTFAHDTAHMLTDESIGKDMDGSGLVELYNNKVSPERNPNYDFRWDQPGRRFRIEETTHFTLWISGEVDF